MPKQDVLKRKEKAVEKGRRLQRRLEVVEYRVEDGDILITSGRYSGAWVKHDLWLRGPLERDYIVKHLWFSGDPEVVAIMNTLVCE